MEFLKLCFVLNCVTLLIITSTCQNGKDQIADDSLQQEVLSSEKLASLNAISNDKQKIRLLIGYLKKEKNEKQNLFDYLEKEKLEKQNLLKFYGYHGYECSFNHMKADLESEVIYLFDYYPIDQIKDAQALVKKTTAYSSVLEKFRYVEDLINPLPRKQHLAETRIPQYFAKIYVILTRNYHTTNNDAIENEDYIKEFESERFRQNFIKSKLKELLGKQELTDDDYFEFALETAKLRHASNMFHRAIKEVILNNFYKKMLNGRETPLLEDIIWNLRIAFAWDITEKNVHYVNILREYKYHMLNAQKMYHPIDVYPSKTSKGSRIFMLNYPLNLCPAVNYIPSQTTPLTSPKTEIKNPLLQCDV